ncbi:MAG: hypothetical protein HRU15_12915 [Planctomycetes bacterium]|nr:hypothetical protein [Planctomycetota bacterium]
MALAFLLSACERTAATPHIHITRLKIMLEHEGIQHRIEDFDYDFETLRARIEGKINKTGRFSGALGEQYLQLDHAIYYFVIKYRLDDGLESEFCIFDKRDTEFRVAAWEEVFRFPPVVAANEEVELPWDDNATVLDVENKKN